MDPFGGSRRAESGLTENQLSGNMARMKTTLDLPDDLDARGQDPRRS